MASYETRIKVRFGDIDHAGIVYYPRISHYLHQAFEDLFDERVGLPYHELLDDRRLGFPTVRAELEFRETFAFGDTAVVVVDVVHLGRSSLGMRYRIRKEGARAVCVLAAITTVCVDMETFRPTPIPEDLRAVFEVMRADPAPGSP